MLSIILYREVTTLKTKIYQGDYQKESKEEEKKAMLHEMEQLAVLIQDDAQKNLKTEKMVVKEDKQVFEYLLEKLNDYARRHQGTIQATIDCEQWESRIEVYTDFFEIASDEERELLREIAFGTHSFNITAAENGTVRIFLMIRYFEDLENEPEKPFLAS